MRTRGLVLPALVGLLMLGATSSMVSTQSAGGSQLATPVFHHVHQNSTDPAAAIAEFQKIYPALVNEEWKLRVDKNAATRSRGRTRRPRR